MITYLQFMLHETKDDSWKMGLQSVKLNQLPFKWDKWKWQHKDDSINHHQLDTAHIEYKLQYDPYHKILESYPLNMLELSKQTDQLLNITMKGKYNKTVTITLQVNNHRNLIQPQSTFSLLSAASYPSTVPLGSCLNTWHGTLHSASWTQQLPSPQRSQLGPHTSHTGQAPCATKQRLFSRAVKTVKQKK